MDLGLKGTVAIVAASSQGLGRATARALADEGTNLVMCARRADELESAAGEIRSATGVDVLAVTADLSTVEGVDSVVSAAVEHFGKVDILVTNAGGPPPGDFTKFDDEAWLKAVEMNLMSVVRLTRAALPHLQKSGRGRVINFSSTSVKQPIEGLLLSNSIRAAVIGMAKTLAGEVGQYGITVNNIAPGRFDTARVRSLDEVRAQAQGVSPEESRRLWEKQIPLGRYGDPMEFAYVAVFLASDKASYITGTTIQVDGGMVKGIM